ncbi:SDR family NAD(P)-dependent oxidoreductase [Mycobacterium sp.]|uniref:SDR family NAD(P)-dependent oxidoreductase n=1 Tax=Mycobacterium sp. TaxID=1785 RepID=UPI002D42A572|nr:SDR family NAD(P)-dependent oxidoreductase [Mycobacterium sp.]HZA09313.1 SDR family NAD(P)-dependent oxidoreductase [Mycobacterium sp.]
MENKVWFITGASRGFGREFAIAALQRGDLVAATARNLATLDDIRDRFGDRFLALQLDVDDRAADFAAVRAAHDRFGRLDIVVNNAGYGHFGAFEELSEADLRDQLETNVFGAVWVTQAALPFLREQGSGHIIQMSSIGGIGAFAYLSAYHASKWALEAMSESLSAEVGPLGINVTLVEPGAFATDWAGDSARRSAEMPEYDFVRQANAQRRTGLQSGDPKAAAQALLDVVDAEKPPLRVLFGADTLERVIPIYQQRLQTWKDWDHIAKKAHG